MKSSRIWLHLLFWCVYAGVNLFNELYLSSSFTTHPSGALLLESVSAQLLVLLVKIPAVYFTIYFLIPRWSRTGSKLVFAFGAFLSFLLMAVCYRLIVQQVIWPYVYHESRPPLSGLQYVARFCYSLLDLLQVLAIASAIRLFRLRVATLHNERRLIQEKLRSEMHHLRAQINPHFLFNTLNSIYALARARSTATPDVVMRLSKILRYILYETDKKLVPLGDELRVLEDYIELQQIRFGEKVHVVYAQDVDDQSVLIVPQLLLPLLENAFKHGTSGVAGTVNIEVNIHVRNCRLAFVVRNTMGTMPSADKSEGIGLSNIRRRMELQYQDFLLQHSREGDTFIAGLQADLNSYADIELPGG